MLSINDLLDQARAIKQETVEDNNSATRIGAWMELLSLYIELRSISSVGIKILDVFELASQLPLTGKTGDAYAVNENIYIWSTIQNKFIDCGRVNADKGIDGNTPYIKNGNWWIGEIDTGVAADAQPWTPIFSLAMDGSRYVQKLTSYVGGSGAAPTANIGQYLKSDGTFTSVITEAATYTNAEALSSKVDKGGSDKTLKQVEDEIVQLAGDIDAKLPINILTSNGSESLTQIGFMRPDGTTGTSPSYRYTQPIEIAVGVTDISLKTYLSGLTIAPIVFFDSNNQFLKGETITATGWHEKTYKVPAGAKFFVSSCDTPYISGFFANQTKIDVPSKAYISSEIAINTTLRQPDFIKISDFTISEFMRPNGTTSANISYRRTGMIDLSGVSKLYIKTTTGGVTVSPIVFFDENQNYISGVTPSVATEIEIEVAKPINAKYAVLSIYNNAAAYSTFKTYVDIALKNYDFGEKKLQCYISVNGNDANDGSSASPVKTISRALQLLSEDGELIFFEGDYKGFSFDLSAFAKITGVGKVRFLGGTFIESATLSSGYTRVYQASYATTISAGYFLWQHDIADEATVIDINERHPLQRGRRTRLSSTRIYQATSIAEIEATTDVLMWFQENGVLYFSKTDNSDLAVNPIVIPSGNFNAANKKRVEINNIQFLYSPLKTTNLSGVIENISAGYVNGSGSIIYDHCVGLTFKNCGVFACSNDGFNGHTYGGGRTSVVFENCYGHDNSDDGESCHEYCDVVHKGGIYEYNGSGITPASGGHAVCSNTVARKNGGHRWCVTYSDSGSGFSAQGAAQDDGIGTSIWCFSCISIENARVGFEGLDESSKYISCVSKGDLQAFGVGEQINCVTV